MKQCVLGIRVVHDLQVFWGGARGVIRQRKRKPAPQPTYVQSGLIRKNPKPPTAKGICRLFWLNIRLLCPQKGRCQQAATSSYQCFLLFLSVFKEAVFHCQSPWVSYDIYFGLTARYALMNLSTIFFTLLRMRGKLLVMPK